MSRVISAGGPGVTGKTVRIFLADGEPSGILLAEISGPGGGRSEKRQRA